MSPSYSLKVYIIRQFRYTYIAPLSYRVSRHLGAMIYYFRSKMQFRHCGLSLKISHVTAIRMMIPSFLFSFTRVAFSYIGHLFCPFIHYWFSEHHSFSRAIHGLTGSLTAQAPPVFKYFLSWAAECDRCFWAGTDGILITLQKRASTIRTLQPLLPYLPHSSHSHSI
jgi:hypothetical protein